MRSPRSCVTILSRAPSRSPEFKRAEGKGDRAGWSPDTVTAPGGTVVSFSLCLLFCPRHSGVNDSAASSNFSAVALRATPKKPVPPLAASGGRVPRSLTPRGYGAASLRQRAKGDIL